MASTTTLAASTYTLTVVPPLAGYQDAFASSINDLGQVAGYVNNPLTPQSSIGFVHRAGVTTAVGKLSAKGTFATAVYVSPTGVVVGDGDTGDGRPQGIVKPGATVYNVYPNNGGNTHALKADAQGRVYGYFIRRGNSNWQGAMWTPNPKKVGTYTETILGGPGMPWGFNTIGQGVGYGNAPRQTAAFWNNTGTRPMQYLATMPDYTSSIAYAIADNGDIVGGDFPSFTARPLLWRASTGYALTELPVLPGDNYGVALGINNHGTIIGTSAHGVPDTWNISAGQYVVWTNGVPTPLATLLDPVTNAGWQITALMGINNSGQLAVNISNGVVQRAGSLTPTPAPAPAAVPTAPDRLSAT
ncbi:MAG: hypothetical protein ACKOZX_11875, partial [Gammaproteobacteria bacterium]